MALQASQCAVAASAKPRRVVQTKRGVPFRAATVALVAAVLALGFYGEHWLLAQPLAAPNELTFAACVLNVDDAGLTNLCSSNTR